MGGPARDPEAAEELTHLVVGQVTKPHGTRGEVFVWPLTDHPEEVFATGRDLVLGDQDGGLGDESLDLHVVSSRPFKRGLLVGFEGWEDRTAVTPWGGRYLLAAAEDLAGPDEDEFFYHELLGLEVETVDGELVGRVREVFETEPAHLLEVEGAEKVHLIPFAKTIIRGVDLEGGRLVIEPPTGLLDL